MPHCELGHVPVLDGAVLACRHECADGLHRKTDLGAELMGRFGFNLERWTLAYKEPATHRANSISMALCNGNTLQIPTGRARAPDANRVVLLESEH